MSKGDANTEDGIIMNMDEELEFQQLLANGLPDPSPSMLLDEHDTTKQLLAGVKSIDSSLLFASLLLHPKYQANCVRLEALVHLAITTTGGNGEFSLSNAQRCFDDLGEGSCGIREDPIEDVFVNVVVTERGSYRVLEGIWESGGFYLQRFLDVLATVPNNNFFSELRESTHALLTLSDRLCRRFGLSRYTVGAPYPSQRLGEGDVSKESSERLKFTEANLQQMRLTKSDLKPFILTDEWRQRLFEIPIGQSPLQQLPLIALDDGVAFGLPSATTYAIRMYLTRSLIDGGYRTALTQQLGNAYLQLFKHTPSFGLPRQYPLRFANKPLKTAECFEQVDSGRYVHKLFVLDDLDGVKGSGVSGVNESILKHANAVYDIVVRARDHGRKQAGFRKGLTLIITCGIGRGGVLPIPDVGTDWSVEAISSPDLVTLAWTKKLDLPKLWKILDAFDQLEHAGIKLFNINGMLNLIGWMKSNDWQVVPHSQVPKDFRLGGCLQLATNFLLDLRASVAVDSDRVGIGHPTKGVVACRKDRDSFFDSENSLPIYIPEHIASGEDTPFVYQSAHADWWCTVTGENREALYERWLTVKTWLPRIIPVIEAKAETLPKTVSVTVDFSACVGDIPTQSIPSVVDIRKSIVIEKSSGGSIRLTVGRAFELGLQAPTNISEFVLVEKLSTAMLNLVGVTISERALEVLQKQIVPNEHARHLHAFRARSFRDYVASSLRDRPVEIDDLDSAALRVGLAFRVESREKGRFSTRTKKQSIKLLNAIVTDLETELCKLVRQFDRKKLVKMALLNHELAIFSRQRWLRTAKANLAIRDPRDNAVDVIAKKDVEISSIVFPSQIIAEFAICEAPLIGGIEPGEIDFTRMMNLVNAIAQFGGWSDAIYLDAMPPSLTITALGDVQVDNQFRCKVLMPFSRMHSEHRIAEFVSRFAENYEPLPIDGLASMLNKQFEDAWEEEIGVRLDDLRKFMDCVEEIGISNESAVVLITKAKLLEACNLEARVMERILEAFVLKPRATWVTLPDGYDSKDLQLWRYRRQLSAVRRPILQIDERDNPSLFVAPGLIRECVAYVVGNYIEGTFPARHFRTAAIRKWHGFRTNQRGKEFGQAVAGELRRHGWECWTEKNVSTLSNCGKDPDYGDVDVVAWHVSQERLLLIECKDLYYGKTAGEIAEQLRDYRGEIRKDGRKVKRDDLRKHLDRLSVLNERRDSVCKSLKISVSASFEGWTVFKNPVPMLHAWEKFVGIVRIATFDDLAQIATSRSGVI